MELGREIQYRTEKGWSGKKYQVRMTEVEIRSRETFRLVIGVAVMVPVMTIAMAFAAGLI